MLQNAYNTKQLGHLVVNVSDIYAEIRQSFDIPC